MLPRSSAGFKGDSVPEFDVMVVSRSSTPNQNPRPTWGSSSNVYASTSAFDRKGFPSDYDMNTRDSDSVISELTMDPQPQSANSSAPKKPRSFYDMVGFDGGGAAASKWETESNHSTATGIAVGKATITPGSAKKKLARKSFFDTSQLAMNEGTVVGRNLLSSEMLEFVKELSVDNQSAEAIRQASVEDPNILLGWQVSGLFVSVPLLLALM